MNAVLAANTRISAVVACTKKKPTECGPPNTALATCAMTVRCSRFAQCATAWKWQLFVVGSVMCTLLINASAVSPTNIVTAIVPIATSVTWALRALGGLNAGTPLAMASTPVSAVQPEENARSVKNVSASTLSEPYPCCVSMWYFADSATGASPTIVRNSPVPLMTNTPAAHRYVGAAKAAPASRSPRRFTAASTTTKLTAMSTR